MVIFVHPEIAIGKKKNSQVIKNHFLDLKNSIVCTKSARVQLHARKLCTFSDLKLNFYDLRLVWRVKSRDISFNIGHLITIKNKNLLYIVDTIHFYIMKFVCALLCAPKPGKYELSSEKDTFSPIFNVDYILFVNWILNT